MLMIKTCKANANFNAINLQHRKVWTECPSSIDMKVFTLLLCARVTSGSICAIVVLIYRPSLEPITTKFFFDLADTMDRVVAYNDRWRPQRSSRPW